MSDEEHLSPPERVRGVVTGQSVEMLPLIQVTRRQQKATGETV